MKEKKIYKEEELVINDNTKYVETEVEDEMKKSFIAYAMAVNVSRAIPDVRDGLKPVHRRIIYAMGEMGLQNDKPYKKCARIVGDVMGKYHPHGDSSIYDALVRLAQDFSINCPLVDGHGNFGSVDGDPPAAQRYTEARMSKIANELLRDINKNTVDMKPNYDGIEEEPTILPARFPNLLVNGSDGIAVGMATNIPPHNLGEVIDGVIALIDNPDITIDELIKIIPAPDFPTRAMIMGSSGVRDAYRTGRGTIIIRSRTEIEEFHNGRSRILVTEIPYQVNKAKLIMDMADLVKNKKVEGISDIRDESGRDGLRIVIEIKKDYNPQVILNYLFKHTQLQTSDGIILLALVGPKPRILNLKEILYYYLEHQKEVILRRTKFDLEKAEERAHILEGLLIAQSNIDEVIATIKASPDKNTACQRLMDNYSLSEAQATAILEMRLQRLTGLEYDKIKEEYNGLLVSIEYYKEVIADPQKVLDIIKTEITEIKEKYATPRKTEVCIDYNDIDIEDLIPEEDVVISLTHLGYIKRQPIAEYRAQRRGGVGITAHKTKDDDFVEEMFISSSHQDIMFFTNTGKVYTMKAYQIPEASKTAKGRAIINMLQLDTNEKVNKILAVPKELKGNMILATKKGLIKKTPLTEFESIRKNGKIAIKLQDEDLLVGVQISSGNDDILVASSEGKCIRFNENKIRETGRTSMGVRALRFTQGEELVEMIVCHKNSYIFTISELGFGKRSSINEYREQGRGGKGILAGKFNEQTGKLVAIKQVEEDQDVIMITNNGTFIRTPLKDISLISRNTKGVTIMKTKKNEKIVSVAIVDHEEEEIYEYDENGNPIISVEAEIVAEETEEPQATETNE